MIATVHTAIGRILEREQGRAVLEKHLPGYRHYGNLAMNRDIPLGHFLRLFGEAGAAVREQILADLNRPVEDIVPEAAIRKSLDELDNESYGAAFTPFGGPRSMLELSPVPSLSVTDRRISLSGDWRMLEELPEGPDEAGAVDARVPGCVQAALFQAGKIPDPSVGRNQEIAAQASYKSWRLRREFALEEPPQAARLCFGGVANRCTVWLNGRELGSHEGMFGGPFFDVGGMLQSVNTLEILLHPIPREMNGGVNESWKKTVVSNNVYGWHYSRMPTIGIWQDVWLEPVPPIRLENPFVATLDHETADMGLTLGIAGPAGPWSGLLRASVEPENFRGDPLGFHLPVAGTGAATLTTGFRIPDARLWHPNGMGEQNLYRLKLSLEVDGVAADSWQTLFGVRTITFAPLPDGPRPDKYNWTFVVNGRKAFVKGTGFCTMDAMMDLSYERYERFLSLAALQNTQLIRAWGAGMPETDAFYDLCDRYGIMVMQEWPTAWDSHLTQPYAMLEETVVLNTLRIRNHPSLALYCGGNESGNPFGAAIDMMGRNALELDGTRTFHRGEPWGGARHNYSTYWGRQNLDASVTMTSDFFGEFGVPSLPVLESLKRYLPREEWERDRWPDEPGSAFEYHTPIFGTGEDLSRLRQIAGYLTETDCTLERLVTASQLAQVVAVRHTLERARTRWPDAAGALYYKLNDNFPALSWATVDWYGAPKLAHYAVKQAFEAVGAYVLPDSVAFAGTPARMPVWLCDDNGVLAGKACTVRVSAYDGSLAQLTAQDFPCTPEGAPAACLGELVLPYELTTRPPLFVHVELLAAGEKAFDTFYFFNFEFAKEGLYTLPPTTLTLSARQEDGIHLAAVTNTGAYPAVGLCVERPGHAHSFTAWDNFLWLRPGESREIRVSTGEGLRATALNAN